MAGWQRWTNDKDCREETARHRPLQCFVLVSPRWGSAIYSCFTQASRPGLTTFAPPALVLGRAAFIFRPHEQVRFPTRNRKKLAARLPAGAGSARDDTGGRVGQRKSCREGREETARHRRGRRCHTCMGGLGRVLGEESLAVLRDNCKNNP